MAPSNEPSNGTQWHPAMAPSNGTPAMAPSNGTQQWHPSNGPQQWHPAMAPSNGTQQWHPSNGSQQWHPAKAPQQWHPAMAPSTGTQREPRQSWWPPPLLEVRTPIAKAIWGKKQGIWWTILSPKKFQINFHQFVTRKKTTPCCWTFHS